MTNEKPWWEQKWSNSRSEVILAKESTQFEQIIDVSAMEKRDIDFIKNVDQRAKEEAIKEFTESVLGEIEKNNEHSQDCCSNIISLIKKEAEQT